MIRKKIKRVILPSALICGLVMSGCGNNTENNIAEDYADNVGSYSDAPVFDGQEENASDHIEFSADDASGKCKLKADIDIDTTGVNSVKVYELKNPAMDDKYLNEFASKLFDNGTYTIEKPYNLLSIEELEAEQSYLEEKYDQLSNDNTDDVYQIYALGQIEYLLYNYDEIQKEKEMETESENKEYRLRGMIDGEECELIAYKDINCIQIQSLEPHPFESPTFGRSMSSAETYLEENKMSTEDASELVYKFLTRIGKKDYEEVYSKPICLADSNKLDTTEFGSKLKTNGYGYCFAPKINGIRSVSEFDISFDYRNMSQLLSNADVNHLMNWNTDLSYGTGLVYDLFDVDNAAYQDYILIDVDEFGFKSAWLYGMYELGDCISEKTQILGMDQLMGAIKDYWENEDKHKIYGGYNDMHVTNMKLCYLAVNYDGKYSLVPMWLVDIDQTVMDYGDDVPMERIAINALDGSVFIGMNHAANYLFLN